MLTKEHLKTHLQCEEVALPESQTNAQRATYIRQECAKFGYSTDHLPDNVLYQLAAISRAALPDLYARHSSAEDPAGFRHSMIQDDIRMIKFLPKIFPEIMQNVLCLPDSENTSLHLPWGENATFDLHQLQTIIFLSDIGKTGLQQARPDEHPECLHPVVRRIYCDLLPDNEDLQTARSPRTPILLSEFSPELQMKLPKYLELLRCAENTQVFYHLPLELVLYLKRKTLLDKFTVGDPSETPMYQDIEKRFSLTPEEYQELTSLGFPPATTLMSQFWSRSHIELAYYYWQTQPMEDSELPAAWLSLLHHASQNVFPNEEVRNQVLNSGDLQLWTLIAFTEIFDKLDAFLFRSCLSPAKAIEITRACIEKNLRQNYHNHRNFPIIRQAFDRVLYFFTLERVNEYYHKSTEA